MVQPVWISEQLRTTLEFAGLLYWRRCAAAVMSLNGFMQLGLKPDTVHHLAVVAVAVAEYTA